MGHSAQFVENWLRHRLVVDEVLENIPNADIEFKPWADAMPLRQLVLHIGMSGRMFANTVKDKTFGAPGEVPSVSNMQELRQAFAQLTEETKSTMSSLGDDDLEGLVDISRITGQPVPGKVVLGLMRDHEIHHKGQLFVYARMLGAEKLPSFAKARI